MLRANFTAEALPTKIFQGLVFWCSSRLTNHICGVPFCLQLWHHIRSLPRISHYIVIESMLVALSQF